MADDNVIRIGVVADVSQLTGPVQQSAATVQAAFERIAASASAAGNVVVSQAAKFQAQGLSAAEAAQALAGLGYSETEAATAAAAVASAAGVAAPALEAVAAAAVNARTQVGGMTSAMGAARVEMGLMDGSTGMMASGLARVAAQSAAIGPIIQAAFLPVAMIAVADIVVQVGEKMYELYQNVFELKNQEIELSAVTEKLAKNEETLAVATEHAYVEFLRLTQGPVAAAKAQLDLLGGTNFHLNISAKDIKDLPKDIRDFVAELQTVPSSGAPEAFAKINAKIQEQKELLRQAQQAQAELSEQGMDIGSGSIAAYDRQIHQLQISISTLKAAGQDLVDQQSKLSMETQTAAAGIVSAQNKIDKSAEEAALKRQRQFDEEMKVQDAWWAKQEKIAADWEKLEEEESQFTSNATQKRLSEQITATDAMIAAQQRYAAQVSASATEAAVRSLDAQQQQASGELRLRESVIQGTAASEVAKARMIASAETAELNHTKDIEAAKLKVILDSLAAQQKALGEHANDLGSQKIVPETAGDTEELASWQKLQNDKVIASQQSADKISAIDLQIQIANQKAADTAEKAWTKATDQINRTFQSNFDQVIRGTETVRFAFIRMGGDIVVTMANNMEKMVAQQLASEMRLTLSHVLGEQTRVVSTQTASAETQAIEARTALSSITHSAVSAAGKAYDAVAGIPIVGPVLGPVAAATAFAGVMAFGAMAGAAQQGAIVPKDMMVLAHQNEMILPAKYSQFVQDAAGRGPSQGSGGDSGGSRGGDTHTHMHINALDSRSFESFAKRNMKQLAKVAKAAARNGFHHR